MLTLKDLREYCEKAEKEIGSNALVMVQITSIKGRLERSQFSNQVSIGKYDDLSRQFLVITGAPMMEDEF